jgi:hypothetical protein
VLIATGRWTPGTPVRVNFDGEDCACVENWR